MFIFIHCNTTSQDYTELHTQHHVTLHACMHDTLVIGTSHDLTGMRWEHPSSVTKGGMKWGQVPSGNHISQEGIES